MASRKLTDKVQISGYRFLAQRIEQGFISRDVRGFLLPPTREIHSFTIGVALAALVIIAALLMSVLRPTSTPGDAKILATKDGARFVLTDDKTLHPVTNLASARLITGNAAAMKVVKDSSINSYSRGQLMGIPSAPDSFVGRTDDLSRWAVCSQTDPTSELTLTESASTRTLVAVGDGDLSSDHRLTDQTAALVTEQSTAATTRRTWLLYKGHRSEISATANPLRSALRLTTDSLKQATPISYDLINAIPALAPLGPPTLPEQGKLSRIVPDNRVGDVVSAPAVNGGSDTWLVGVDAVQKIGPFAAQLFAASGAPTGATSAETMANAPEQTLTDLSGMPWDSPRILTGSTTVCYDWARRGDSSATTAIAVADSVPLSAKNRSAATTLIPARVNVPQAQFFFTTPGRGWLVGATGQDDRSATDNPLWWVSDTGVRYAIGGDDDTPQDKLLGMLGITAPAHLVPWAILQLLPEGNTLSVPAANVIHANIPPDANQQPIPDVKDMN